MPIQTNEGLGLNLAVFQGQAQGGTNEPPGKWAYDRYDASQEALDIASEALGWSVPEVAWGRKTHLQRDSRYAQAMVVATGVSDFEGFLSTLENEEDQPDVFAYVSLGGLTAAVAARALRIQSGVRIAEGRGGIMKSRWFWRKPRMVTFDGFPHGEDLEGYMNEHGLSAAVSYAKQGLVTVQTTAKKAKKITSKAHLPEGVKAKSNIVTIYAHDRKQRRRQPRYRALLEGSDMVDPKKDIIGNDEDGTVLTSRGQIIDEFVDQLAEEAFFGATVETICGYRLDGIPIRRAVEIGADTRFGLLSQIVNAARNREAGKITPLEFVPRVKKRRS